MQFISPNELLTALSPVIYERLAPRLQRVLLKVGSILFDVGATIDYTRFIISGIISLLCLTEDGASALIRSTSPGTAFANMGFEKSNSKNEFS